jgi:hypothetical protein
MGSIFYSINIRKNKISLKVDTFCLSIGDLECLDCYFGHKIRIWFWTFFLFFKFINKLRTTIAIFCYMSHLILLSYSLSSAFTYIYLSNEYTISTIYWGFRQYLFVFGTILILSCFCLFKFYSTTTFFSSSFFIPWTFSIFTHALFLFCLFSMLGLS